MQFLKKSIIIFTAVCLTFLLCLATFASEPAEAADPPACTITGQHELENITYEGNGRHGAVCRLCSQTVTVDCVYPDGVDFAPDGAGNHTNTCTVCGGVNTQPCSFKDNVVWPTQTEGGYTEHTCSVCGYAFTDGVKGPESENPNARKAGDMDGSGAVESGDARTILRMAVALETPEDALLPYAELDVDGDINAADARLALRIAVRLDTFDERHEYAVTVTSPASCTATGKITYNCVYCGKSGELTTPKTPHAYGEPAVTASTCTVHGKSVSVCAVCGDKKETVLPLAPHAWVAATASAPKHCSVCGLTLKGWIEEDGKWYYYSDAGDALTGKQIIGGLAYMFDKNGVSSTGKTGWEPKVGVIGDSIVEDLANYLDEPGYDFYGKIGVHADTIFTKRIGRSDRTVIDEIRDRGYDVVIILLGVNDLTYYDNPWGEMYRKVIRGVQERAPEAMVICHAILPVNESRAANYEHEKMSQVNGKNAVIRRVAAEEGVRYLDASPAIAGSDGQLPYDAATDGVHFGPKYCKMWFNWIAAHL